MNRRFTLLLLPLLVVSGVSCSRNPTPEEIVRQVADFYRSKENIEVKSELVTHVKAAGMENKTTLVRVIAAQRPNRLSVRVQDSVSGMDIICDGSTLVMHFPAFNRYDEQTAPQSFGDMRYNSAITGGGFQMFILELLADDPYAGIMEGVTSMSYIGRETIEGVDVHHLTFTQEAFDWEAWIRADGDPTLEKISIDASKSWAQLQGSGQTAPQTTIVERFTDWKFDRSLAPETFVFSPPTNASKQQGGNLLSGLLNAFGSALGGQPSEEPNAADSEDGPIKSLEEFSDAPEGVLRAYYYFKDRGQGTVLRQLLSSDSLARFPVQGDGPGRSNRTQSARGLEVDYVEQGKNETTVYFRTWFSASTQRRGGRPSVARLIKEDDHWKVDLAETLRLTMATTKGKSQYGFFDGTENWWTFHSAYSDDGDKGRESNSRTPADAQAPQ